VSHLQKRRLRIEKRGRAKPPPGVVLLGRVKGLREYCWSTNTQRRGVSVATKGKKKTGHDEEVKEGPVRKTKNTKADGA